MLTDGMISGATRPDLSGLTARLARLSLFRIRPESVPYSGMLPWVPFFMSLGIGGWFSLRFEPGLLFYLICSVIGVSALGLAIGIAAGRLSDRLDGALGDRLRILAMAVFVLALGADLAGLRAHLVAAPVLDFRFYGAVEGRVVEIDRSSRDRLRLTLDRVTLEDVRPEKTPKRVRISLFSEDRLPVPGQTVMLTAHLSPPSGPAEPGGFDYRRVAWFERLGGIGYTRSPVVTIEPPEQGGWLALHRLRMSLSAAIRESIGGQAGAVSAALMTGDRSAISEATNQMMRDSNLYHIISISGLHMSMLCGFVYMCLRTVSVAIGSYLRRPVSRSHKWAAAGALLAAAAYLWLSGGDVATKRSFLMIAVMLLAIIFDRRALSVRTLALAASLILAFTPEALLSPGFQMSFAATFALILANRPWQAVASGIPFWLRPILMLLVSSLVAGLATSPIAAAHFGRVTQYGLLANMLVVPVVGGIVMPAGVIAALLAPISLADIPLQVMGFGTSWMLRISEWIARLDGAVFLVPAPPANVLPLFGVGLCLIVLPALLPRSAIAWSPWRIAGGVIVLIWSLFGWVTHERPLLLISADGAAVGLLTSDGRAVSKPAGGGYVISEWLKADGDWGNQETSFGRVGWSGPPHARESSVKTALGSYSIYHLTGKKSSAVAESLCKRGAIIISNTILELPVAKTNPCIILDINRLRRRGAVALGVSGDMLGAEDLQRELW